MVGVRGGRDTGAARRSAARAVAGASAALLLALGFGGFVPGVTADLARLGLAGPDSAAQVFGLFGTSVLHNVAHVLLGLVGLIATRERYGPRYYLLGGGAVLAAAGLWGLLTPDSSGRNALPSNFAGDLLHLGLATVMLACGRRAPRPYAALARRPRPPGAGAR